MRLDSYSWATVNFLKFYPAFTSSFLIMNSHIKAIQRTFIWSETRHAKLEEIKLSQSPWDSYVEIQVAFSILSMWQRATPLMGLSLFSFLLARVEKMAVREPLFFSAGVSPHSWLWQLSGSYIYICLLAAPSWYRTLCPCHLSDVPTGFWSLVSHTDWPSLRHLLS